MDQQLLQVTLLLISFFLFVLSQHWQLLHVTEKEGIKQTCSRPTRVRTCIRTRFRVHFSVLILKLLLENLCLCSLALYLYSYSENVKIEYSYSVASPDFRVWGTRGNSVPPKGHTYMKDWAALETLMWHEVFPCRCWGPGADRRSPGGVQGNAPVGSGDEAPRGPEIFYKNVNIRIKHLTISKWHWMGIK